MTAPIQNIHRLHSTFNERKFLVSAIALQAKLSNLKPEQRDQLRADIISLMNDISKGYQALDQMRVELRKQNIYTLNMNTAFKNSRDGLANAQEGLDAAVAILDADTLDRKIAANLRERIENAALQFDHLNNILTTIKNHLPSNYPQEQKEKFSISDIPGYKKLSQIADKVQKLNSDTNKILSELKYS